MTAQNPSHLYLVSGNDDVRIHAQAEELFRMLAGETPDDFAIDVIVEDDTGPNKRLVTQLISSIRQPAFLGGAKTIWLKQFSGFAQEPVKKDDPDPLGLRTLAEILATPLPDDIFVILEGATCAERGALAKACAANGQVIWCRKIVPGRKGWRDEMGRCISEVAAKKGISLNNDAMNALMDSLGGDTTLIAGELDKLICYAGGPEKEITAAAVRTLCPPFGDQENWALAEPIGKRDLAAALTTAEQLMSQAKDDVQAARSLLYAIGRQFRSYMAIRLYMMNAKIASSMDLKRHLEGLSPEQKRTLAAGDAPFVTQNVWQTKYQADYAKNYTPHELVQAICSVRDTLLALNSGGMPAPIELESALLKIVPDPRKERPTR